LTKTSKKVESLHPLSPSLPADTTHVVHQPQPRSADLHLSTDKRPDLSLKKTETISTLIPANGFTNDQTNTPSTPTTAHVSNVAETQTLSSQLADPQQPTSPSILTDIPEFFTAQVNSRPHKPGLLTVTRPNTTK